MKVIKGKCPLCDKSWQVEVKNEDYQKYRSNTKAQHAFPYLSRGQRELLISGVDSKCWDAQFKD